MLPEGRFQHTLIVLHFIMYIANSFIIYNFAFFQMQPQYQCLHDDNVISNNPNWHKCDINEVCDGNSTITSWKIDWDNSRSLHNWVTNLNMHCSDNIILGYFGSLYFLGFLISSIIFPPLSDKVGRLKIFMAGCFF